MDSVEKVQYPNTIMTYDKFNWPSDVPRKPFSELTQQQRDRVLNAYRFSGFKPGMYQAVSGINTKL